MSWRVVEEPTGLAVSLASARTAARVNGTALDEEIEMIVRARTADAEHYTGRAIIERPYRLKLDAFDGDIELPTSPVQSVVDVLYVDEDGETQTLDPADYTVDNASEPGFIVPAFGKVWPATRKQIDAITIDVVCGYGPDETTTPAPFKAFILARVRENYAPAGTPESKFLLGGLDCLKVW